MNAFTLGKDFDDWITSIAHSFNRYLDAWVKSQTGLPPLPEARLPTAADAYINRYGNMVAEMSPHLERSNFD